MYICHLLSYKHVVNQIPIGHLLIISDHHFVLIDFIQNHPDAKGLYGVQFHACFQFASSSNSFGLLDISWLYDLFNMRSQC
jgi:hypothetical protein